MSRNSVTCRVSGLHVELTDTMSHEKAIFIDLGGNSISCVLTKCQAKKLSEYLKNVSRLIDGWQERLK